uniref:metallophosphoesterase family protein n=1 Tax=Gluconobacter thailandicus TaxID=257438 RepID=UPI000A9CDD06|nr:hypothetical protein [Gluconobacter thailandicus]
MTLRFRDVFCSISPLEIAFIARGFLKGLEAQVNVVNLFDKGYISSIGTTGFENSDPSGTYQTLQTGAPRQVSWLKSYLQTVPAEASIIISTHIPMVTAFYTYADESPSLFKHQALSTVNTREILALLTGHNVLAVFQGHTHVLEQVEHNGIQFITGGAVSGNWWHGLHLGTPEGYMIVHVENNTVWTEYKTYEFHTVSPENTY